MDITDAIDYLDCDECAPFRDAEILVELPDGTLRSVASFHRAEGYKKAETVEGMKPPVRYCVIRLGNKHYPHVTKVP